MGLRFSNHGPEFPSELIESLLKGNVVFLCGAGVSSPQLPGFEKLVSDVYKRDGSERTPSESAAIAAGRFEEALGSLSRRLSDPNRVHELVAGFLHIEDPNLSNHKVLLRLSRGLDNKIVLVTTNFDTLFERALDESEGLGQGRAQSLAGQALPPPGAEDFFGIIHLHGRITDHSLGLESNPLVLRSSDYGDAYMRSGWAARFLFDLVRCRTLVLIGYGANDAPVRYFLNVLEADRARFSDLQTVYAFDAVEQELEHGDEKWGTVAVQRISYCLAEKSATNPHEALWRDLGKFADLIERPKATRRARAEAIFSENYEKIIHASQDEVYWLLNGKRDLWDIVITHVSDPNWFDHFAKYQLWSDSDACWVMAAWCGRDWQDIVRLETAISWHQQLGSSFGRYLDDRLSLTEDSRTVFNIAWDLLRRSLRQLKDDTVEIYRVSQRLLSDNCCEADLVDAVCLITPKIKLRKAYSRSTDGEKEAHAPARLRDIVRIDLSLDDRGSLREVTSALRKVLHKRVDRLPEIALEALRSVVAVAHEAELIIPDWDSVNSSIPSVEDHIQNEYHDGAVHLAVLLTAALPPIAINDPQRARSLADSWKYLPSLVGTRLCLQAMRQKDLYSANEVANAVLLLTEEAFWSIKRELILVIEERIGDSKIELSQKICDRILDESPHLFKDRSSFEQDQTDWRPQARSSLSWLRLTALKRAGALPSKGLKALRAISAEYPYINGDYSESDLFSSYSTSIRTVKGNANSIASISPEQRLSVAHSITETFNPETRQDWSAYCASNSADAFEVLKQGKFGEADVSLWHDLLNVVSGSFYRSEVAPATRELTEKIFAHLVLADDAFIKNILPPLADLLRVATNLTTNDTDMWWDRLWQICETENDPVEFSDENHFGEMVLNNVSGRLARQLISAIDERKKATKKVSVQDKQRLVKIFESVTSAGWIARGILAADTGFLVNIDRRSTLKKFKPWISNDDIQGATLRSILVKHANLGPKGTRAFKNELINGLMTAQLKDGWAAHAASMLIGPLINQRVTSGKISWGISDAEVKVLLSKVPSSILDGAAKCFSDWISQLGVEPEKAWRDYIGPTFDAVWPTERRFRRPSITLHLAALCVGSGKAFPESFKTLRHYLGPLNSDRIGLYFLASSSAPEKHPATSLDLLWLLCGPDSTGQSSELGKILDQITSAAPELIVDRRLQWLEQQTVRYG